MDHERSPRPKYITAGAFLLLALMAVLAGGAARRESITVDEVAHVGAGVSYLQKLDLRLNVEHPPLAKVLAAIPLVIRGTKADYSNPAWAFSDGFFKQYLGQWVFGHWLVAKWNDPYSTMFLARMPMLLVTLLLGWLIYFCGSKLGDAWGGLLCLAVYVSTPTFLTFGPLVLTDIVFTFFTLLALWTLADMWRSPTREATLKFGFALSGALLSKFSAGLLFFCFLVFILSLRWQRVAGIPSDKAELRSWRRRRWGSLIKATLLSALVVYAVYFVLSWGQPTDSFSIIPHFSTSPFLRRILMPPWMFLQGLVTFAVTSSRPTYILGHSYPHGVWFYFPVMFVLKSPLAFLGLLLLAVVVAVIAKVRLKVADGSVSNGMEFHRRAVWIFLCVFTVACMLSRLTMSIRHFSVPIVLLILLLAPLPGRLEELRRSGWPAARFGSWLTVGLALVCLITAVRAYPYYMPFLNTLSMGRPGYELVNDSNLDWNQALPQVEQWTRRQGIQHVLIDEYGFSDPTVYVRQGQDWNCQTPSTADAGQWAVVSAGMIADGHNCLWLLQYPHEILAGGGMYAFQLPAVIPPEGAPGGPPLPKDRRNFAGAPKDMDFRAILYACIQDPRQLQITWDGMQKKFEEEAKRQKAERENSSRK